MLPKKDKSCTSSPLSELTIHTDTLLFKDQAFRSFVLQMIAKWHPKAIDRAEREWLGHLYRPFIEKNLTPKVEVRWVNEQIGWGVFALEPILAHTYIGEYVGEVKRYWPFRSCRNDYVGEYSLGEDAPTRFIVDAEKCGNITRWINHNGLRPNLTPKTIYLAPFLRLIFLSNRPIAVGEQLAYDYGPQYWRWRAAPEIF